MKFKLGQHVIAKEDFEAERRMSDGNRMIIWKVADVKKGQEAIVTGELQNTLTLFLLLDYGLVVPLDDDHFEEKSPGGHLLTEDPPITVDTDDESCSGFESVQLFAGDLHAKPKSGRSPMSKRVPKCSD